MPGGRAFLHTKEAPPQPQQGKGSQSRFLINLKKVGKKGQPGWPSGGNSVPPSVPATPAWGPDAPTQGGILLKTRRVTPREWQGPGNGDPDGVGRPAKA